MGTRFDFEDHPDWWAFSPDGRALAAAVRGSLGLYHLPTGLPLRKPLPIQGSDWGSVDRKLTRLAAASLGSEVGVYDLETGKRIFHTPLKTKVNPLYHPDGSLLVVSTYRQGAEVWDVDTGRLRFTLEPGREIRSLALAPKGDWLAVSSVGEGDWVRVWDMRSGKPVSPQLPDAFGPMFFSGDGSRLATTAGNSGGTVWSLPAGSALMKLDHAPRALSFDGQVAFSLVGQKIIRSPEDEICEVLGVYVPSGKLACRLRHRPNEFIYQLAIAADGRALVTRTGLRAGGGDCRAQVWLLPRGMASDSPPPAAMTPLPVPPSSRPSYSRYEKSAPADGSAPPELVRWDAKKGRIRQRYSLSFQEAPGWIAWHASQLYCLERRHTAQVLVCRDGKGKTRWERPVASVVGMAGDWLIASTPDGLACLDVEDGTRRWLRPNGEYRISQGRLYGFGNGEDELWEGFSSSPGYRTYAEVDLVTGELKDPVVTTDVSFLIEDFQSGVLLAHLFDGSRSGELLGLDLKSGEVLWSKKMTLRGSGADRIFDGAHALDARTADPLYDGREIVCDSVLLSSPELMITQVAGADMAQAYDGRTGRSLPDVPRLRRALRHGDGATLLCDVVERPDDILAGATAACRMGSLTDRDPVNTVTAMVCYDSLGHRLWESEIRNHSLLKLLSADRDGAWLLVQPEG